MNPKVDLFLQEGCGRCKYHNTPQCKVHHWHNELVYLRNILQNIGLEEDLKWGMPCYTYKNANVVMLAAFKEYCSISFFKGSLLQDENKLLVAPGDNSQAVKMFRFTNLQDIKTIESTIKAYLFEAIEIEKMGLKVAFKSVDTYEIPEEFQKKLNEDEVLKLAFEKLTPGRQRSYLLHFSQAKQAKTRESRIEKCIPSIMAGKGFNEY